MVRHRIFGFVFAVAVTACGGDDTSEAPADGGTLGVGGGGGSSRGAAEAAVDAGTMAEGGREAGDEAQEEDAVLDERSEGSSDAAGDRVEAGGISCPPNVCCFGADGGDIYAAGHLKPDNQCMLCDPAVNPFDWTPGTTCPIHEQGCTCVSGTPTEVGCSDGFDNDYDQAIDCSDPDCDGKQCYGTGRQFPTTRELLPSQPGSQAYKLAFAGVVGATGGTIVKAVLVMPWLSNDPNRYTLDLRTLQDPSQPACVGAITYTMNGYVYRCDVTAAVLNWFASAVPDAERGFVLTGTPGLLGTTNLGIDIDRRAACIQKHCTPQ